MHRIHSALWLFISVFGVCLLVSGQQEGSFVPNGSSGAMPAGARVFITSMEGGFDTYLAAGLVRKKVPLIIVTDKSAADFEISGVSASEKANWAKMLFAGSQASNEEASIKVVDLKTGSIVFAYAVHKVNSARGKQSAAEACAKHINQKVRSE